jgi:antitoxin VapB
MGINIKNAEAVRLIRELAELAGEGQTEAVVEAVRERIERLNRERTKQSRVEAMMEIARQTAPLLKDFDMDEAMYGENGLYDRETGLPK